MILPTHPVMFIDSFGNLMMTLYLGCCLFILVILTLVTLALFRKQKDHKKTSKVCEQCGAPVGRWDSHCERCGSSIGEEQNYHSKTTSRPSYTVEDSKRDEFSHTRKNKKTQWKGFRFFNKKKVCQECGTELIYRDAYDSWYCPECHTYK